MTSSSIEDDKNKNITSSTAEKSLSSGDDTIADPNTEKTVESIKHIARSIKDGSTRMRELVRAVRQSGAIDELAQAIHEASIAAKDTTKEISETTKDLKDRGIIRDTAEAIEQTNIAARETADTVRQTAEQARQSAPQTTESLKETATKLKSKRKREIK